MKCDNCGAKTSRAYLFVFSDSDEKTRCGNCNADLIDRTKYPKWRRVSIGVALLVAPPVIFLTTHPVTILVFLAISLAACITLPVNKRRS